MRSPREAALQKIAIGDIFHASATNGASLLCLTMNVTATRIQARNVATQIVYDFDRRTGLAEWRVYGTPFICTIDSTAPLPPDIREIMSSLDRKYREGEYRSAEDPDWQSPPEDSRLTKEQIRGLLFVDDFYRDNPV